MNERGEGEGCLRDTCKQSIKESILNGYVCVLQFSLSEEEGRKSERRD